MHRRLGLLLASAALFACMATDGALARRYHRHRIAHRGVHTFVFRSPDGATVTANSGKVGGYFETGILGASTADPYEHPSYGYYVDGGQGPGYSYYGD